MKKNNIKLSTRNIYSDAKKDHRGCCCVCGCYFGCLTSVDLGNNKRAHIACHHSMVKN
jgi:hypothetical protein